MTTPRLVTADDVCTGVETVLRGHLAGTVQLLGLHQAVGTGRDATKPYPAIKSWDQLPTADALSSANFPCGAISSPGLVEPPTRRARGRYDATWRVAVGVYDKGSSYNETQHRIRTWAALVRATLLDHPSLDGVAQSLMWVGEEYRAVSQASAARTLGGCAVAVDVTVPNVVDLDVVPVVASAATSLSVRPPQE